LWHVDLETLGCDCEVEPYVNTFFYDNGVTFSPEGGFYAGDGNMLLIDPITGLSSVAFTPPPGAPTTVSGLVSTGGGIFYKMDQPEFGSMVYRININDGTMTPIGETGYPHSCDLTLYNGEVYYCTKTELIRINLTNPSSSEVVVNLPMDEYYGGMTASHFCNELLVVLSGPTGNNKIALINVQTGEITLICDQVFWPIYFTSMREHEDPVSCVVGLELGCGENGNTSIYDCLSEEGAHVTGESIHLFADADITTMTITIAPPIPDAPNEFLEMTGIVPNINETGSGTSSIMLTNAGGASTIDFKEALQLIVYKNISQPITQGLRTIEVQFTTASGAMSNVAEYFVDVQSPGQIIVDLGPDIEACEGSATILDAGNPGAIYVWSTGDDTQTISVEESGEYIVTASDGVLCPGIDTVIIDVIPNIEVVLTGDTYICENEEATLLIQTDSPFPLKVIIDADPGSPFIFTGIDGTYSFTDLPFVTTTYTITEVVPDQAGCIEIPDPEQIIEVYSTFVFENEVSLCDGDSIWLGYFWESTAGTYENLLESIYGCDSMVTTHITILPAVQIAQQSTTCDPSAAGVFITHLNNPNGCDTVVTTTVTLVPSDTTPILLSTCVWTQAGIVADTFSNQAGCDSLVITTTSYVPPADTTFLHELSCDSSLLGLSYDTLTTTSDCDSIVAHTVSFSSIDTTYTFGSSCIPSEIGVFETLLTDASGCDSLVISTVAQGQADTTVIFTTSCDPSSIGVFEELLISSQGCDSLIITTVTFSAQDSTFITSSTCDPAASGVFVTTLINQFGCDSIVTETISLLPSDVSSLNSTTCDPSAAGIFTQMLTNQYGCDSIVTETVTLLPSDQITLASTTCIASQAGVFITTLTNQYGCDSVVTETVTLLPGDTTSYIFNTCDPSQVGNVETIYTAQDGCDSLVIEITTLFPLPVVTVQSAIDYNGFDISCAGDADGSAIANASGTTPFTYLWSTTETDPLITGLSAGAYAVSVTDGNGCTTDGVITLTEPALFMIGFEVSEPDCFDQQLGSITVKVNGGVAPYTYSIDGTIFQSSPDFTGLSEGIYQITSLDANDCSATEIISIDVPLMVQVELGDNQVISLGDSSLLQAIVNLPFDSLSSVMWTDIDSIDCPNCLTQLVAPIITTAYTVSVTSIDGCADRDSMTVTVTTDQNVYIPNIFSPNGDGVNDVLSISVGEDVEEISSFSIFDRWGNLVFGAEHILPNDPTISWDGKMKGEVMNPGVFTFKLVVVFANGEREVRYGDITLLR